MIKYLPLLIVVTIGFSHCKPSYPQDIKSYRQYLSDPDHGFIKIRKAGPFIFTLKYLPASYLAMSETEYMTHPDFDSLLNYYSPNLHFLFTIAPNPEKAAGDVTYSSIETFDAYDSRQQMLNFRLKDYWSLQTPSGTLNPVLTQYENTHGLTEYRNIHLVFSPSETNITLRDDLPWTITFRDEIWGTGINRWSWED